MSDPRQLPMFDLPPIEELPAPDAPARAPKVPQRTGRRMKQLSLAVRQYVVRSGNGDFNVQAATPSAAKYAAFKIARSLGQFLYRGGFMAFASGGTKVEVVRGEKKVKR